MQHARMPIDFNDRRAKSAPAAAPPAKFWPQTTMTQEESRKQERERLARIHAEQGRAPKKKPAAQRKK